MKVIYKYELSAEDVEVLFLPEDVQILSAKEQNNKIVMYAMLDDELLCVDKYEFSTVATGLVLDYDIDEHVFLDTVKLFNGKLMYHVFYKKVVR